LYWKKYQLDLKEKLKATGQNMAIAGDGRHDSMGHSAKYCAYTLFCCTVPLILDFSLIQASQFIENFYFSTKSGMSCKSDLGNDGIKFVP